MPRNLWTQPELAILQRDFDAKLTPEESAKNLPGRTPEAITTQRSVRFGTPRDMLTEGAVHVRLRIGRQTYARASQHANALKIMPAVYIRHLIEQTVDGNEIKPDPGQHIGLSQRARGHFIAEAAKRGISMQKLFSRLLEAIAESQLTNAVLDDEPQQKVGHDLSRD